jgi:hypothetical protein
MQQSNHTNNNVVSARTGLAPLRQTALYAIINLVMIAAPAYATEPKDDTALPMASPAKPNNNHWQPVEDYLAANPAPHSDLYGAPKRLSLSELQAQRQKKVAPEKPPEAVINLEFAALPPLYNSTRLKPVLSIPPAAITAAVVLSAAPKTSPLAEEVKQSVASVTPSAEKSDQAVPAAAQCATTSTAVTKATQQDQATLAALHQRVAELKLQDRLGFLLPTATAHPPTATPVPAISLENPHAANTQ